MQVGRLYMATIHLLSTLTGTHFLHLVRFLPRKDPLIRAGFVPGTVDRKAHVLPLDNPLTVLALTK